MGAFGGAIGPSAVGWLKDQTGGFCGPMLMPVRRARRRRDTARCVLRHSPVTRDYRRSSATRRASAP